jgi:hypothetical protein
MASGFWAASFEPIQRVFKSGQVVSCSIGVPKIYILLRLGSQYYSVAFSCQATFFYHVVRITWQNFQKEYFGCSVEITIHKTYSKEIHLSGWRFQKS